MIELARLHHQRVLHTCTGAVSAADLLQGRISQPLPAGSSTHTAVGSSRHNARINTGSTALDALLGGGGVACGTVTEFCEFPMPKPVTDNAT